MADTIFLNVDLDITSRNGLEEIIAGLLPSLFLLNKNESFASLELVSQEQSPDATLASLVDAVRRLPSRARELWENCERRTFNVGIQAGTSSSSAQFCIEPSTLALLAAVNGEVVITIYSQGDQQGGEPRPA